MKRSREGDQQVRFNTARRKLIRDVEPCFREASSKSDGVWSVLVVKYHKVSLNNLMKY